MIYDRKGTEGCHAFSLNIDYFNMEGMRTCGARMSCSIISMVCLNLLVDVCYKPGPKKPHLMEANHYIRPLVNDHVDGYDPRIQFSRKALHPNGHLACCNIVLVACDTPGGRKLAQPASHSSNFLFNMQFLWP